MRAITILITILITFASCNCQKKASESNTISQKQTNDMKLIYEANSRGFYQKVTIENKEAFVLNDRNSKEMGTAVKISDADWDELTTYFNKVKLEDLATLKDPTQKRFYDGAAVANLKVNANGTEYQTLDFDHGFPPVEIEKLVNKINSFAKK